MKILQKRIVNPRIQIREDEGETEGSYAQLPFFHRQFRERCKNLSWMAPPFPQAFLHHRRLLCFWRPWPWNGATQLGFEIAVVVVSPFINTASLCSKNAPLTHASSLLYLPHLIHVFIFLFFSVFTHFIFFYFIIIFLGFIGFLLF